MATPVAQRDLFDEPGAALSIRIESADKALSKNQRLFNQLAERLRALRAELTSWQHALDRSGVAPLRKSNRCSASCWPSNGRPCCSWMGSSPARRRKVTG
ncbi:hypothetical protein [Pelomicrobium sp. G1]|uniref:hypothetical protein n=1 Tax=unclassified Pelomicrobium TaxID=2815318 RepID=UPI003F7770FC